MGSLLACKGIHVPSDPNAKRLGEEPLKLYRAAYENAKKFYSVPGNQDPDELAQKAAWKTVRLFYQDPMSPQPTLAAALPEPSNAPSTIIGQPDNLVRLGYLLEYTSIDGDATLHRYSFEDDPPALYWDDNLKSLFVFPGTEGQTQCVTPPKDGPVVRMFKTWAQRAPKCESRIPVPEVDVKLDGWIDTLLYRSDKWHDPNPKNAMQGSQIYIHQHGDGVGVWTSPSAKGKPPAAIVITGGCLDVESRGIIH